MHTAICTFENRADAERAVERLVQSGFDRGDVHLEYRHPDGTPMDDGAPRRMQGSQEPLMHGEPAAPGQANDNWDSMEREVAMDYRRVKALGNFFHRLFGHDDGVAGHAASYSGAVERGLCVVVVDAHSEDEAERAQQMLHGMEGRDLTRLYRAGHPPLRDIVGERQAAGMEQQFGTARSEMGAGHNMDVRGEGELPRERATASQGAPMPSQGWGEQRRLDLVQDDQPIASPSLRGTSDRDDKPR